MILVKYLEELNSWYGDIHVHKHRDNIRIIKHIKTRLGLTFVPEYENAGNVCMINSPEVRDDYKQTFMPIDLLDYIYAVLHSPRYLEKHKDFLKIDFQKVPYPENAATFWQMVHLGGQLRHLHLLKSPKVTKYITSYPIDGNNEITTKIVKKDWQTISLPSNGLEKFGRIWINDTQFFDNIPLTTWEHYIGENQPAQQWLKVRKGCTLDFEDILQYQKIIVALTETLRLMQVIDTIKIG